jgi:hypothetical protein
MKKNSILKGPDEIMAVMRLPWAVICQMVEREGLPVKGLPDSPTLNLEDLAAWQAAQGEDRQWT